MWQHPRRKFTIGIMFFVWLGAAALACGYFSPSQQRLDVDDMMLAAPADNPGQPVVVTPGPSSSLR
jgi:hypothetical protein